MLICYVTKSLKSKQILWKDKNIRVVCWKLKKINLSPINYFVVALSIQLWYRYYYILKKQWIEVHIPVFPFKMIIPRGVKKQQSWVRWEEAKMIISSLSDKIQKGEILSALEYNFAWLLSFFEEKLRFFFVEFL